MQINLDQLHMLNAVAEPMRAEGYRWRPATKEWTFGGEVNALADADVAARASELLTAKGIVHTPDDVAAILPGLLVRLTRVMTRPDDVRPLLEPRADG